MLAGLELDNIWYVTDLINIAMVFVNAPAILIGGKYVFRALQEYAADDSRRFAAEDIGLESDVWTKEARTKAENV